MKKMILLMVVLGLVLTAEMASAGVYCRCWRLSPWTDTIKVCAAAPLIPHNYPIAVAGSWIQDVGSHKTLVPMSGSLQKDITSAFTLRLMLQGTIKDLSLASPFIHQCNIDANIGAHWDSIDLPVPGDGPTPRSSVLAYCEGLFPPDSPFTNPDELEAISCYDPSVLNPINPGEVCN
jgi:hypothetical protein